MNRARVLFLAGLVLVLACGAWSVLPLLPGPGGELGHDYAYFLPRLLAGDYFFARNGPFALPWFSPAFGAGLPFYAHPASSYVSLPQWLSFLVDPLRALQLAYVATLVAGFAGMWLLLRRVFALSAGAALVGAVLFALNGFHSARFLVGHLSLHSSVLAPLIAYLLLRELPGEARARRWRALLDGLLAGIALAYLFQSGNVYGLPPVLLAVLASACLAHLAGRTTRGFAPRLALALAVALALCASKLEAGMAYLASFPREGYPLPGARSALGLARVLFQALFLAPPTALGNRGFEGLAFPLGEHEWDFRVGPLALLLVAGGALAWLVRTRGRPKLAPLPLALLLLVLAIPFVLNLHGERWTPFLKSLPLLKSSSSFVRWFFAYVPVLAVLAALACERLRLARFPDLVPLAAALAGALLLVRTDRASYRVETFDSAPIVAAWRTRADPPPIRAVGVPPIVDGQYRLDGRRDALLVSGQSQLLTYEPLFGYRLEWRPRGPVRAGDALREENGAFNFQDPRLFLGPDAQGRAPGAPFLAAERATLERFLDYGPLAWEQASPVTPVAALLVLLLLALALGRLRRRE